MIGSLQRTQDGTWTIAGADAAATRAMDLVAAWYRVCREESRLADSTAALHGLLSFDWAGVDWAVVERAVPVVDDAFSRHALLSAADLGQLLINLWLARSRSLVARRLLAVHVLSPPAVLVGDSGCVSTLVLAFFCWHCQEAQECFWRLLVPPDGASIPAERWRQLLAFVLPRLGRPCWDEVSLLFDGPPVLSWLDYFGIYRLFRQAWGVGSTDLVLRYLDRARRVYLDCAPDEFGLFLDVLGGEIAGTVFVRSVISSAQLLCTSKRTDGGRWEGQGAANLVALTLLLARLAPQEARPLVEAVYTRAIESPALLDPSLAVPYWESLEELAPLFPALCRDQMALLVQHTLQARCAHLSSLVAMMDPSLAETLLFPEWGGLLNPMETVSDGCRLGALRFLALVLPQAGAAEHGRQCRPLSRRGGGDAGRRGCPRSLARGLGRRPRLHPPAVSLPCQCGDGQPLLAAARRHACPHRVRRLVEEGMGAAAAALPAGPRGSGPVAATH